MNERPLQPMVEFTPAACSEVRRALDRAIEAFGSWGIDLRRSQWIQAAAEELEIVSNRSALPESDAELRRISSAAALVVDLYHISTCLGEEPNEIIAKELASIRGGELVGTGNSAAGKDVLTQFWIGALLAQSQLSPHIIAYDLEGKSKPDFIISKGKTRFAVEVKKPRTASSAVRAVETGARQLRQFEGPGIIVIDATECLSTDPWGVANELDDIRAITRHDLSNLQRMCCAKISPHIHPTRFSHLAMLVTFARYWNWIRDGSGGVKRDAGLIFHANGFGYLWSAQITGLTKQIQESLLGGIKQLTGNPPSYEYKP